MLFHSFFVFLASVKTNLLFLPSLVHPYCAKMSLNMPTRFGVDKTHQDDNYNYYNNNNNNNIVSSCYRWYIFRLTVNTALRLCNFATRFTVVVITRGYFNIKNVIIISCRKSVLLNIQIEVLCLWHDGVTSVRILNI